MATTEEMYEDLNRMIRKHENRLRRVLLNRLTDDEIVVKSAQLAQREFMMKYEMMVTDLIERMIQEAGF